MSMPSDDTGANLDHWQGRYSDGKTAGSSPVDVRIGRRGLEVGIAGQQQALVWPYGALGVATPISGGSADVLVTYSYQPGASLFVADPTFVRALAGAAPQLTARSYSWRAARPWMISCRLRARHRRRRLALRPLDHACRGPLDAGQRQEARRRAGRGLDGRRS